jgi:hypothetical protein
MDIYAANQHRLFVGCRGDSPMLVPADSSNGNIVTTLRSAAAPAQLLLITAERTTAPGVLASPDGSRPNSGIPDLSPRVLSELCHNAGRKWQLSFPRDSMPFPANSDRNPLFLGPSSAAEGPISFSGMYRPSQAP